MFGRIYRHGSIIMAKGVKKQLTPLTPDIILEACNNDLELVEFFNEWVNQERNATKAYEKLHPSVTYGSARELGSRTLARIDKQLLMRAYGLDIQRYWQGLNEGLDADKWNDYTGEREADHKTRKLFHDKLGKLLGLESDKLEVDHKGEVTHKHTVVVLPQRDIIEGNVEPTSSVETP